MDKEIQEIIGYLEGIEPGGLMEIHLMKAQVGALGVIADKLERIARVLELRNLHDGIYGD